MCAATSFCIDVIGGCHIGRRAHSVHWRRTVSYTRRKHLDKGKQLPKNSEVYEVISQKGGGGRGAPRFHISLIQKYLHIYLLRNTVKFLNNMN